MKAILFLFLVFSFCSCNNQSESTPAKDTTTTTPPQTTLAPQEENLYSIQLNDATLSLQQWDSTINLEERLGKPIKQKTKQLDLNSDTHSGSFTKDLEWEGLKLKLFSPKQNGKTFWIQEIILTNNKYKTTKGITIGDDFEKVKQAYPSLKKFPGENDNMFYVADDRYEKSMEMEFEKNKLKKLRMYYMMN